mmetsp:Transcript_4763/g.17120  ORF Transcript_4763/g.17120 Transcript_4763/m.17120 type:complete len:206 (+) Transcript_4763:204-821(+)
MATNGGPGPNINANKNSSSSGSGGNGGGGGGGANEEQRWRERLANRIAGVRSPTPEQIYQQDLFNNCAVKAIIAGVAGVPMGLMFGLVFGGGSALDPLPTSAAQSAAQLRAEESMTNMQKVVQYWRDTGRRSWGMAKTFAAMGFLYAGSECIVEQARAQHDVYNSVAAGCFTGGAMAARSGPQAMCLGCAGFAAFSALIDIYLEH